MPKIKGEFKQFRFTTPDGAEYVMGDKGAHLELTRERVEQSIRDQAQWAESSPHLTVDAHMGAVTRARRVAIDWLEGLKQVELELHRRHTKAERKDLTRMFSHYSKLLAEALATMGEYEQALVVLPKHETALRKEYQALLKAVWRDDAERCGEKCAKAVELNPSLKTQERIHGFIFSKKHGRIMPAATCSHCGAMNVRPLEGQSLARHTARKQADEIIKGKTPEQAIAALRIANLTADQVL